MKPARRGFEIPTREFLGHIYFTLLIWIVMTMVGMAATGWFIQYGLFILLMAGPLNWILHACFRIARPNQAKPLWFMAYFAVIHSILLVAGFWTEDDFAVFALETGKIMPIYYSIWFVEYLGAEWFATGIFRLRGWAESKLRK